MYESAGYDEPGETTYGRTAAPRVCYSGGVQRTEGMKVSEACCLPYINNFTGFKVWACTLSYVSVFLWFFCQIDRRLVPSDRSLVVDYGVEGVALTLGLAYCECTSERLWRRSVGRRRWRGQ